MDKENILIWLCHHVRQLADQDLLMCLLDCVLQGTLPLAGRQDDTTMRR